MVKSGFSLLVFLFLLSSCVSGGDKIKNVRSHDQLAEALSYKQLIKMGTYLRVSLPQKHTDLYRRIFNKVDMLEKEVSHFDKNSKLNQLITSGEECTSNHFKELASRSQKYKKLTSGAFNIFYKSSSTNANLAETSCGLRLEPKGAEFDFGAIGKGFVVDKIRGELITSGVTRAVVAFSGDITCLHVGCSLGVQDPLEKDEVALLKFKSKVNNISISTSGNYRRKNHIKGDTDFISVTLISEYDNTKLDAFTTAAYLMPLEKLELMLLENNMAYILVTKNKKIILSENLGYFIDELSLTDPAKSFIIVKRAP